MKTYNGWLNKLEPHQIFVFGSNPQGRHGAGNAKAAHKFFGAIWGQASGLQGQSWGIITTDLQSKFMYPMEKVIDQIETLYGYAREHPELEFFIAYSANGEFRSGFSLDQMGFMFAYYPVPSNIVFEEGFAEVVKKTKILNTEL